MIRALLVASPVEEHPERYLERAARERMSRLPSTPGPKRTKAAAQRKARKITRRNRK